MIQAEKGTGGVWESEEINYQTLNLESKVLALISNCTSSVSYSASLGLSFPNCQMCMHMGGGRRGMTSCLRALSTVMTLQAVMLVVLVAHLCKYRGSLEHGSGNEEQNKEQPRVAKSHCELKSQGQYRMQVWHAGFSKVLIFSPVCFLSHSFHFFFP